MEASIVNFRSGRHTQKTDQIILKIKDINNKEKTKPLIGKQVIWITPSKKEIKGTIKATHGNSGCVRAKFEKGMPGQSIGTKVSIK